MYGKGPRALALDDSEYVPAQIYALSIKESSFVEVGSKNIVFHVVGKLMQFCLLKVAV